MHRTAAILAATLLLPAFPAGTQTTSAERAILRHVDTRYAAAVALLERLVNINSGTMNFPGVRAVGDVLRAELGELGFGTRWIDGAPFGRAGHLVAERPGRGRAGRPRILLIGHLDTVFEPDSPFQRFERLDDSTARGPGVVDMKGGNVVMLEALRALAAARALDGLSVRVIFTGDEERSGRPIALARAALVEAAEWADIAIAFENGDSDYRTAVIARRGSSDWTLRVRGRPAHSSQIFRDDVGAGAAFETARILHRFREELAGEPLLTFNPGLVFAGTDVAYDSTQARGTAYGKSNVVAEHAVVTGDLRTISPEQLARTKARMTEIAAASLPHTAAELRFDDSYPPLAPSDGNRRLLALLDRVSRDLGFGPVAAVDPRLAGAADVSFTAGLVDMALDGLGTGGGHDHTVQEFIDLRTLPLQAKRVAVLLYRLGRPGA